MAKEKEKTTVTQEQANEFELNRLGYYCKVRESWNRKRRWWDFRFDFVRYENNQEIIVTKGTAIFEVGEKETIKRRNVAIDYYLKKLKNNQ